MKSDDLQAECLAANGIEVRQSTELVVRDVISILLLRGVDLGAEFGLNILILREQVQDASEGV